MPRSHCRLFLTEAQWIQSIITKHWEIETHTHTNVDREGSILSAGDKVNLWLGPNAFDCKLKTFVLYPTNGNAKAEDVRI